MPHHPPALGLVVTLSHNVLTPPLPCPCVSDPEDPLRLTDATRSLGLVVLRGTAVMVVGPTDGTEEIANPFLAAAEEAA